MRTGFWKHFLIRKMHFSGQILLVFSVNPHFFENASDYQDAIHQLQVYITELVEEFSGIKSVYISHNKNLSDTVIGDLELVAGTPTIEERLLGYSFDIGPESFFQTNSV